MGVGPRLDWHGLNRGRTLGSRKTYEGADEVYKAAALWVDRALRTDDSLFTPGVAIWTSRWLRELRERFLNRPDEGGRDFYQKLTTQLEGSPPEVYQLMGEVLYVQFLVIWHEQMGGVTKKNQIEEVLGWGAPVSSIPDGLIDGFTVGIARSQTLTQHRPFQVGLVIEFVEQWKQQEPARRQPLLKDPWDFKDFVMGVQCRSVLLRDNQNTPRAQREALLHLVHPDTFEGTVTTWQKEEFANAKAFAHFLTEETTDVDRKLVQIRRGLEAELGRDFDFYDPDIGARLDNKKLWDEFVKRAQAYVDSGRLEVEEIDYKVGISRKLRETRAAVFDERRDDWAELLKNALNPSEANFVNFRVVSDLNNWCASFPNEAKEALGVLWAEGTQSDADRISAFANRLPKPAIRGSTGNRTNVVSVLLMGLDVEQYPPFKTRSFNRAYKETGYHQPEKNADEAAVYQHALGFLDRLIDEAVERGLKLRHRLDAQSVVWAVLRGLDKNIETNGPPPPPPPPPGDPWAQQNIEALAGELLWDTGDLQKIIDGLKDKRQAIFQGPPGTGKTFMAKRIAEWCREHGGDFQIVQFHSSYSYEDFVEGFRPTLTDSGQAGFKLTKGPLRKITEQAEANEDATFVLVIDEINRGNVAKVLGELYFLLEYRGEKVGLQYSNEQFGLPKNLWIIGTMNTTDRAIALVDAALRRRFYFFGFFPDEPPVKGLLRRWVEKNNPKVDWVADLVDLANRKLEDRHLGIGPSHFMKKEPPLDKNRVRFIWEQAVIPYIEEQCFGDEEKLKEFGYDRLKRDLVRSAASVDGGNVEPEGETNNSNGRPGDIASDESA